MKNLLLTLFTLSATLLNAQSTPQLQWHEVGPKDVGGEVRAILIDKDSSNKIFAASNNGGLFISRNYGRTWNYHATNAQFGSHAITSIVQAINGDIYYGTGLSFVYSQQNEVGPIGSGIYKSTDGGETFQRLASTKHDTIVHISTNKDWLYVNAMAVSPTDPANVYAATETGLFHSTNAGVSWQRVKGTNADSTKSCRDVKVSSNGTVHASFTNHYYRSTDGHNFSLISITSSTIQSCVLAVTPLDPNYVYASLTDGNYFIGLYRSIDNGSTWAPYSATGSSTFNPVGNNAAYSNAIAVSPVDKQVVFIGGQITLIAGSDSAGWVQLSSYTASSGSGHYIHADIHTIVFDPKDPGIMYIGSDGGISKSIQATTAYPSFYETNAGFDAADCYDVDVAPNGTVITGMEDLGTYLFDSTGNGVQILAGFGGYVAISKFDSATLFAETPNAQLFGSLNAGNNLNNIFDLYAKTFGTPGSPNFAPFIAPIEFWEKNRDTSLLVIGIDGRILLTRGGSHLGIPAVWFSIGTAGDPSEIKESPDGSVFYIGTNRGEIYRITGLNTAYFIDSNRVITGDTISLIKSFSNRYVSGIAVDPLDNGHIIVTLAGYGYPDNVYEGFNADSSAPTFQSIQGNLPVMPVYTAVIDHYNSNNIIVGTDMGIWMKTGSNGNWTEQDAGLSSVPVYRLKQQALHDTACQVLYAATYGRGIFGTTSLVPNNIMGCELKTGITDTKGPLSQEQLKIYPNPTNNTVIVDLNLTEQANVLVSIIDIQGKALLNKNCGNISGPQQIQLDVSKLVSGTYLISVQTGEKITSQPLLIVK